MQTLKTIKTLKELAELQTYLADKEFIAFDTETTGVDKDAVIIGYSVCAEPELAYYVITQVWDVPTQKLIPLETVQGSKAFMEALVGKALIMHNACFDCRMVVDNYKVSLIESVHTDTMILAHVVDENRPVGLKPLGIAIFGDNSTDEQDAMKESVLKNGGQMTKKCFELYKGDPELIAEYGAKDVILTLNVFYHLVPQLYEQGLEKFFYEEESMPLLRGPTYDLNSVGLRIDPVALSKLKSELQAECLEAKGYIYNQITPIVAEKYPGTSKKNTFNIGAGQQLSWLIFNVLGNEFNTLTKGGQALCKGYLGLGLPYTKAAKDEFIAIVKARQGEVWERSHLNKKTGKRTRDKKVDDWWKYLSCGKESLAKSAKRYKWVETLLTYKKNLKMLNTYVEGIESRMRYNVIQPSFLQHGTTSGRYSCKDPNFQNLPRKDKRIKSCIISRKGKSFVGADYEQLEPRVFASFSQDERLMKCFADGDDFYAVIGMEVFEKYDCNLKKSDTDKEFFGNKYPDLRDDSKVVGLSSVYGTTAPKMAMVLGKRIDEAQAVIDGYFEKFPKVLKLMLDSHELVKKNGAAYTLFGRPRRLPMAKELDSIYGKNTKHAKLPYEARKLLNLGINHRIQGTGSGIMNRAAIAFKEMCMALAVEDPRWADVKLVSQIHDELIAECDDDLIPDVINVMQDAMENTVVLPGVALVAKPKAAKVMSDLK